MNQTVDFTNLGGLPVTQFTTAFMQSSYINALMAIAKLCGDKTILFGCEQVGGIVSSGWISYNGELLPLVGGSVGTGGIKVIETVDQREYENTQIHDVYFTKTAVFSTPSDFNYSELVSFGSLKNLKESLQQQITDLVTALANHTHTWASITDKPSGYITYLGTASVGDIANDKTITITIPNQGGTNYMVAGSMISLGSPAFDNDIGSPVVHTKTATSFKLTIGETSGALQNLSYEFAIIKTL